MDRGKRAAKAKYSNSKMYMDLKDIIRENALCFLPAKSLFKFTSVCRDWKLLISTPFFAHNQSFSFKRFSGLFCQMPNAPSTFIPFDSNAHGVPDPSLSFFPEPVVIRCSSNGLVCCQGSSKAYYMCNPLTKQWKKLPQSNADHGADPAIVLIFEPSLLSFEAEYKLVCAFKSSDFEGIEFEIFSSKEGSWKVSGEICFGNRALIPRSGVYADGVVYWMTASRSIFGFNLTTERSIIMTGNASLGVLNGKLCSFSFNGSQLLIQVLSNAHTNTMAMNKRDPGWKTLHHIQSVGSTPAAEIAVGNSANGGKPSKFLKHTMGGRGGYGQQSNSVLFSDHEIVVFQTEKKVIAVDLKTNGTTVLMTNEAGFERDMRLIPYVNSLISL